MSQTYKYFELIIVNDGSTDNSALIVKTFTEPRIRLYTKENGGVSSARNYGIRKAKYDLIALLDADDWWEPHFLVTLLKLSEKYPLASIYGGQYLHVLEKDKFAKLDRFPMIKEGYFELYDYFYALSSSSIIIRKSAFADCGYFDENLTISEDNDMWIRIAMKHGICYTSELVSYYDISLNPLNSSRGKRRYLKQHLLSKIDQYIGLKGAKWDQALTRQKIKYLDAFFIANPFNKEIKRLIRTIPKAELCLANPHNINRCYLVSICKSIILRIVRMVDYYKNVINLKMPQRFR